MSNRTEVKKTHKLMFYNYKYIYSMYDVETLEKTKDIILQDFDSILISVPFFSIIRVVGILQYKHRPFHYTSLILNFTT